MQNSEYIPYWFNDYQKYLEDIDIGEPEEVMEVTPEPRKNCKTTVMVMPYPAVMGKPYCQWGSGGCKPIGYPFIIKGAVKGMDLAILGKGEIPTQILTFSREGEHEGVTDITDIIYSDIPGEYMAIFRSTKLSLLYLLTEEGPDEK